MFNMPCARAFFCTCIRVHICFVIKAVAHTYETYKERQAYYAQFKRLEHPSNIICTSHCPCRQIGSDGKDVPAALKEAWETACKTKCKTAKNKLFTAWLQSGGDWGSLRGCMLIV